MMNPESSYPDSWKVVPLKAVASYSVSGVDKHTKPGEYPVRLCNYTDVYKNESLDLSHDFMRATATLQEIKSFKLAVDDIVITKDSETWDDIANPCLIKETADDFICAYHLGVIRTTSPAIDPAYLFRLFQSEEVSTSIQLEAKGVTRVGLPKEAIGNQTIPIPPIEVQKKIADYLDKETKRIDDLIEEKEKMLLLLEEKKRTLITQAVTKGINPNAKMKDSGIPWLGDVPEHWEIKRGKNIFYQAHQAVEEGDEIVTCFRDGTVTLRKNRRETGFTNAVLEQGYQRILEGQLMLHSMDAFGGSIGVSDSVGKCTPEYIICIPHDENKHNNFYYAELFKVMAKRNFVQAACNAVRERAPRIRFSHVADMKIPVPSIDEQNKIIEQSKIEIKRMANLSEELNISIGLLQERRSALISEVVTGKKQIA